MGAEYSLINLTITEGRNVNRHTATDETYLKPLFILLMSLLIANNTRAEDTFWNSLSQGKFDFSARYRAAWIVNGRLESCLFIARDHSQLPDRNWLQDLFREQTLDNIDCACLLAGKSVNRSQDTGPIVCSCFGVGRNTILQTIIKNNLTDITRIDEYLQAGTNCGSCIPELRQLLQGNAIPNSVA